MEMVAVALNVLIVYIVVTTLFRLIARSKQAKIKEAKKLQIKAEVKPIEVIEKVKDDLCGCLIPRNEAYILVKEDEDKEYYFCSWNCRQKFIKH